MRGAHSPGRLLFCLAIAGVVQLSLDGHVQFRGLASREGWPRRFSGDLRNEIANRLGTYAVLRNRSRGERAGSGPPAPSSRGCILNARVDCMVERAKAAADAAAASSSGSSDPATRSATYR